MIATLESFRQPLEDLGGGLGATDPVSGNVVLPLKLGSSEQRVAFDPSFGGTMTLAVRFAISFV